MAKKRKALTFQISFHPHSYLWSRVLDVGTLVGRSAEVVTMLSRRKVDFAGLQEVRYKNVGTKTVKGGFDAYKLYWSGESTGQGGVGLMVHVNLVKKVIDVKHLNSRIIVTELAIKNEVITVLSVYAPQPGLALKRKTYFTRVCLSSEMLKVNDKRVKLDFNGHVGKMQDGYKECMETLVMESKM